MGLKLRDLQLGDWFRYPSTKQTAVLQRLGPSGATIRYTDRTRSEIVTDFSDVELVSRPVKEPVCACDDDSCEIPQAEPKQE